MNACVTKSVLAQAIGVVGRTCRKGVPDKLGVQYSGFTGACRGKPKSLLVYTSSSSSEARLDRIPPSGASCPANGPTRSCGRRNSWSSFDSLMRTPKG